LALSRSPAFWSGVGSPTFDATGGAALSLVGLRLTMPKVAHSRSPLVMRIALRSPSLQLPQARRRLEGFVKDRVKFLNYHDFVVGFKKRGCGREGARIGVLNCFDNEAT
jgi:hypothetical protein